MYRLTGSLVVVALLAGAAETRGDVVAFEATGFNDQSGINATPTPNSPYTLGAMVSERGVGEPGWVIPWHVYGPTSLVTVATDHVFEGDGALKIQGDQFNSPHTSRQWADVLEQFSLDQKVLMPPGSGLFLSRIHRTGLGNGDSSVIDRLTATRWEVEDSGALFVYDGTTRKATGFSLFPNRWYDVRLDVDVVSQTYKFYFENQPYAGGQALHFYTTEPFLDRVDFMHSANVGAFYIDAIRMSAIPEPSTLMLLIAAAGLVAACWVRRRW